MEEEKVADINRNIELFSFSMLFLIKVSLGHEFELKQGEEKAQNQ